MTGSTNLDIEVESEASTEMPKTAIGGSASPVSEFIGPPKAINAEVVSRNRAIVTFDVPVEGPDVCYGVSSRNSRPRSQPRQIQENLSCCQRIFREPPFLSGRLNILINAISNFIFLFSSLERTFEKV